MASAKGIALLSYRRLVEQNHGAAAYQRLVEILPEPDRQRLEGIIMPQGWYPIGIWNRLLEAYVRQLGRGDDLSVRAIADHMASSDLSTVFKVLLKLATPEMILQRAPSLWDRYFDTGTLESSPSGTRRFTLRLKGPQGVDEAPGRLVCVAGVPRWLERAVMLAGARDPACAQRACRFRGSPSCEFEITWS